MVNICEKPENSNLEYVTMKSKFTANICLPKRDSIFMFALILKILHTVVDDESLFHCIVIQKLPDCVIVSQCYSHLGVPVC